MFSSWLQRFFGWLDIWIIVWYCLSTFTKLEIIPTNSNVLLSILASTFFYMLLKFPSMWRTPWTDMAFKWFSFEMNGIDVTLPVSFDNKGLPTEIAWIIASPLRPFGMSFLWFCVSFSRLCAATWHVTI